MHCCWQTNAQFTRRVSNDWPMHRFGARKNRFLSTVKCHQDIPTCLVSFLIYLVQTLMSRDMSNHPSQYNFFSMSESARMLSAPETSDDLNRSSRPPSLLPQFTPVALNTVRGHGHAPGHSHGHSHVTGQSLGHAAHGQPGVSRVMQFQIPVPLGAAAMDGGQVSRCR